MKQAAHGGVVLIFDMNNPRLEADDFALLVQELVSDLYFFSLSLIDNSSAS